MITRVDPIGGSSRKLVEGNSGSDSLLRFSTHVLIIFRSSAQLPASVHVVCKCSNY